MRLSRGSRANRGRARINKDGCFIVPASISNRALRWCGVSHKITVRPTMKRFTFLVLIANFALAERLPSENPLTVHEWGTFTSVTRLDGRAAVWAPLQGPGDLPCFVERLGQGNYKPVSYTHLTLPTSDL